MGDHYSHNPSDDPPQSVETSAAAEVAVATAPAGGVDLGPVIAEKPRGDLGRGPEPG